MSLQYNKDIIKNARELRKNMTRQERHLWYDFLSKYYVRFQRQKTIKNYIVDFYCHKAKLAIELDGSQHYEDAAKVYDKKREDELNAFNVKILRFSNLDIDKNFQSVCSAIDEEVNKRLKLPPGFRS